MIKADHQIRSGGNGFTLMELVLAMGVCAIVLTAVSSVLFSAMRLRESVTQVVEESLPVRRALVILQRDLQGVMPFRTNGVLSGNFKVGEVQSPGISGTVAIELYTTTGALHDNEPWGDVQRVTYEVRPAGDAMALIRRVTRNLLARDQSMPDGQKLMANLETVSFECYDGAQWRTSWDTTMSDTNLPCAVRVHILRAGDALNRQPVTLVVPLDAGPVTNQIQSVANS